MPKAVVLFSGGLDSTVALSLACWRHGADQVLALGVAYGQAHINELTYAKRTAATAGVRYVGAHVDPSPWKLLPLLSGTTVTGRDVYAMKTGGISDAFLPGRNVAFLSMALAVAAVQDADQIWSGANADDAAGFPDGRPPFLWAWQQMASHALGRAIHLEAPLLDSSKREIVALARAMAIDLDATWSCYRPRQGKPCGTCDACVLRAEAVAA